MLSYPQQIELLNLKERIINNPKMLPHLCRFEQEGLFDTEPEILTNSEISGDIRWQAKQIGWIIKNV